MWLIKCFSDFSCVVLFWRYLRSKSKVVKNCTKFLTFFARPNLVGQNLYPRYHAYLAVRRLVKFPSVIATSPKVIGTFVMNFKLIFKCSRLKSLGGPRPCFGYELDSLGQPHVCVKIWGASYPKDRNLVYWKSPFVWVNMSAYNFFVSGPKFTNFFRLIGEEL